MTTLIVIIHVFVCVALIMIVLLQTGKGASIGASLGGGASQTLLSGSGASTFLSKTTTAIAIIFMLTSLSLAYLSGHQTKKSIVSELTAPVEATAAPVTEQATPVDDEASSDDVTDSTVNTAADVTESATAGQPSEDASENNN